MDDMPAYMDSAELAPYIEPVPLDFQQAYERNLHKSLMNHSGVSQSRTGRLLKNKTQLYSCYDSGISHPFVSQEIELSTGDNIALQDY